MNVLDIYHVTFTERQQTHGLLMGSKSSHYTTESVYQLQEEILIPFLFE